MSTFNYGLVPKCIVEATEVALMSYMTPIMFLSGPRAGTPGHKVKIRLIHESAIALAIFQHLLMHPRLLETGYDVRWEHELKRAKGTNVPRADLYLSPQKGKGGVKTWVEIGGVDAKKVRTDAEKLVLHRPKDSLFLLLLDLNPPKSRTNQDDMHGRLLKAAKQKIKGGTLRANQMACRLLELPITALPDAERRIGFGLLRIKVS